MAGFSTYDVSGARPAQPLEPRLLLVAVVGLRKGVAVFSTAFG
jgi:hypothetical protein